MSIIRISFLLSLFLLCACGQEVSQQTEITAIESGLHQPVQVKNAPQFFNLQERMKEYKVPGVSIAVMNKGKIQWQKAYGQANTTTGDSVTTQTLFQAGSISKPVAALAVLKLVDKGKIDLDENANQYLKDWKIDQEGYDKEVSVRQLLTHTSGLNVMGFPGYTRKKEIPSVLDVLNGDGITPAVVLDTLPGVQWKYSGGGYTVLQKIVEDVSGLPFEQYLEKEVLLAMDMHSSTYAQPLPEALHPKASAAYDRDGKIIDGYWHNYPEMAAAGLWTIPSDLLQYGHEVQKILQGEKGVVSQELIKEMLTKHKFEWGLGPQLRKAGDSLLFQHGGKNAGFTNMFIASARQGFAVAVMTNGDNGQLLMQEIIRSISEYYNWNISPAEVIEPFELTQQQLELLTGVYSNPGSGEKTIQIDLQENHLRVKESESNEESHFIPRDSTTFIELKTANEIKFKRKDSGQMQLVTPGGHLFIKQ